MRTGQRQLPWRVRSEEEAYPPRPPTPWGRGQVFCAIYLSMCEQQSVFVFWNSMVQRYFKPTCDWLVFQRSTTFACLLQHHAAARKLKFSEMCVDLFLFCLFSSTKRLAVGGRIKIPETKTLSKRKSLRIKRGLFCFDGTGAFSWHPLVLCPTNTPCSGCICFRMLLILGFVGNGSHFGVHWTRGRGGGASGNGKDGTFRRMQGGQLVENMF